MKHSSITFSFSSSSMFLTILITSLADKALVALAFTALAVSSLSLGVLLLPPLRFGFDFSYWDIPYFGDQCFCNWSSTPLSWGAPFRLWSGQLRHGYIQLKCPWHLGPWQKFVAIVVWRGAREGCSCCCCCQNKLGIVGTCDGVRWLPRSSCWAPDIGPLVPFVPWSFEGW